MVNSPTLTDGNHGGGEKEEEVPDFSQKSKSNSPEYDIDGDYPGRTPVRFLPLHHVYSATSPCNGSSKKVRARKLALIEIDSMDQDQGPMVVEQVVVEEQNDGANGSGSGSGSDSDSHEIVKVYSRQQEMKPLFESLMEDSQEIVKVYSRQQEMKPLFDSLMEELEERSSDELVMVNSGSVDSDDGFVVVADEGGSSGKKRRVGSSELVKLGVDSNVLCSLNGPRLRESRVRYNVGKNKVGNGKRKRKECSSSADHSSQDDSHVKKWFRLAYDGVEPISFVGLKCKVYWPLDNAWYKASITSFDSESKRHSLKYEDGDEEEFILADEQIKFYISKDEMKKLNFRGNTCMNADPDYSQLLALAALMDESREPEPGDIIWAKLTGHKMWPAIIMDESLVRGREGLNNNSGGKSVPVQFFGTYDFARIRFKQIVSFVKGLNKCFHLKCKRPRFLRSFKEAKIYLNEQKLPKSMLNMQQEFRDIHIVDSDETLHKNEDLSNVNVSTKSSSHKLLIERYQNIPNGYRPVCINWKDLDRCNVCHMDEEYENNLFLQCDKCRMMVHARCYGEEFVEGALWLCNLCQPGKPEFPPPCRLCPVVGGAMKPTTDGGWAHLACAIWIPETCLSDTKKMEPIDGLSRINKDRWKLLCSICRIPYGACIQCSNNSCRVAYHPLCARVSGLCLELEDEDRFHLIPIDEDEEEQRIHLLSFCPKHMQRCHARPTSAVRTAKSARQNSSYEPYNKSGCARCEPYDYSARRGRKAPEIRAAESAKRLFIENRPYVVGGYSQHDSLGHIEDKVPIGSKFSLDVLNRTSNQAASQNILSMADKYKYMKETVKKRLTFGKSMIHDSGIFAKQPHKAGDMVIEYTGEIVRGSVADRRERLTYNLLVGGGTYMFRIDDERVIDATRAGSIAHLINHSCEPNCYSRVITVNSDEHIIIFAKRDIEPLEELTYDYRFFAIDERLLCHCGSKRCRGVVNDVEAEERASKLRVPRGELVDCAGQQA